jgi:hypothetical protein
MFPNPRILPSNHTSQSVSARQVSFPAGPPIFDLTLDEANDIEKLLSMLDTELTRITDVLKHTP